VNKQQRKILGLSLKIVITGLSFVYILITLKNFFYSEEHVDFLSEFMIVPFLAAILLMPLNWLIESVKWRFLVKELETIKIRDALKAVFSGITFAVFTPNRIGELVGRIFILDPKNRSKAVFATATGSLSQQTVTLFAGVLFGMIFLMNEPLQYLDISSNSLRLIKILSLISLMLAVLIFFNLKFVVFILRKLKLPDKILSPLEFLVNYNRMGLLRVLSYSFLRYAVFVGQFILLLMTFGVDISIFDAFTGIALSYFASSVIPSFTLAEIGIRGSAALFFLGIYSDNDAGIFSAAAVLWMINLAVPAVIGSVFFSRTKI
jgi:hypothetical protein